MKHRTVVAVVRSVSPAVAVAVLFAGLLAGGASAARAEGRITLSRMTVQSCSAMGKCHWQLTCKVGKEQLVQDMTGTSRDVKEVGKAYDTPGFPVNVKCTLAIDDGWFTIKWKQVGQADLAVPGGGDYDLAMANKENGGVTLHVTVDSLEIGAPPAPPAAGKKGAKAPAGPRLYVGVFHGLPQGAAVLAGLPWDQFKARADQLDAHGSRIVSLSSSVDGGKRLWSGVFRSGEEKQLFVVGLDFDAFAKKYTGLVKTEHMRLVGLEVYDEGGKHLLLTGAYREGYDKSDLWVGQTRDQIQEKLLKDAGTGLRLVDLDAYKTTGDKVAYAGVFREGSGSYGLWTALDRDALLAKWKKGDSQVDQVKTYVDGKKRQFDAVIGSGGVKTELDIGLEAPAFAARWKEQMVKGMRLVDVESYQE